MLISHHSVKKMQTCFSILCMSTSGFNFGGDNKTTPKLNIRLCHLGIIGKTENFGLFILCFISTGPQTIKKKYTTANQLIAYR